MNYPQVDMDRKDYTLAAWHAADEEERPAPEPDYYPGNKVWVYIVDTRHMEYDRSFWKPGVIISKRGQSDQATPIRARWFPLRVELADGQRLWVWRDRLRPLDWKGD